MEGVSNYFVLYPDGLRHACEHELLVFGGRWLSVWPEQCAGVIALRDDDAAPLPATFSLIFRTFAAGGSECGSVLSGQVVDISTIHHLVSHLVNTNAAQIQHYLGATDTWRITTNRRDVASHKFQSTDVETLVGSALSCLFADDQIGHVSLTNYVNELCVWVGEDIVSFGCAPTRRSACSMSVDKGDISSRADDAVAASMAWIGLSHALQLDGPILQHYEQTHIQIHTDPNASAHSQVAAGVCTSGVVEIGAPPANGEDTDVSLDVDIVPDIDLAPDTVTLESCGKGGRDRLQVCVLS